MTQCTAPIRGHRTAAAACPVCGDRRSYYQFGYNSYPSFSSRYSNTSNSSYSFILRFLGFPVMGSLVFIVLLIAQENCMYNCE